MLHRRLAFVLFVTLLFPLHQVVTVRRDVNAEETVAVNFLEARHRAGMTLVKREEGSAFATAACGAAYRGRADQVWLEGLGYVAVMYSTSHPEDVDPVARLAQRPWKADDRLVTGVCFGSPPAFPAGRYWVAVGVLSNASQNSVSELLGGRAVHLGSD